MVPAPAPPAPILVLLGTQPTDPRGGIGVAMAGFIEAARDEGLLHAFVPTYDPSARGRHWRLAVRAARPMIRAIRAIREAGEQPIIYTHAGSELSVLRETTLLRLAARAGARTMIQLHSYRLEHWTHGARARVLRQVLHVADSVCVSTERARDRLAAVGLRGAVQVVPDPLPSWAEQAARTPRAPRRGEGLRVVTMTRLVPGKGVDLAIAALRHADPSTTLVVAGDGPEAAALARAARDLGDRVRFAGWVGDDDRDRLLRDSDVFLLPTRYDSFGMGFIEAACFGLPSVALRWGPIPEVVGDGRTGLLVDDPDPAALGAALDRLRDPALRQRLGDAARRDALDRFSVAAVGRAIRAALPDGGTP